MGDTKSKKKVTAELTDEIYQALVMFPQTRNSDKQLYLRLIRNRRMETQPFSEVFLSENAPNYDSVTRIRRKIQQAYPNLRATEEVENGRMLNEEYWHSYGQKRSVGL